MATYQNGRVPARLLVKRGVIRLTAGTWAKWDELVADVKNRHGVTLTITQGSGVTSGSGGYRDYAMQQAVKQKYVDLGRPNQAATAGTSSHGGEYRGRDALAIDVNNYWAIPQGDLFAAARRAGFTPGVFDGKQGRPLEPWHLIDYDPYRKVEDMTPDQSNKLDAVYESVRYGQKGVRNHGRLTADLLSRLGRVELTLSAQSVAIEALATANGADPAAILKAVEDGVSKAMDSIEVTLSVDAQG